ncbi:MAG: hypothetical protein M1840_000828 [Geoglossum simile]|nr:MAG: hypothetical protein M1840_000828 [Geoglossum simile]
MNVELLLNPLPTSFPLAGSPDCNSQINPDATQSTSSSLAGSPDRNSQINPDATQSTSSSLAGNPDGNSQINPDATQSTSSPLAGGPDRNSQRLAQPSDNVEKGIFIWYHRDDLGLSWKLVMAKYNIEFPKQKVKFGAIRTRYYKILKLENQPPIRERSLNRLFGQKEYGVVAKTGTKYSYPWMEGPDAIPSDQGREISQLPD